MTGSFRDFGNLTQLLQARAAEYPDDIAFEFMSDGETVSESITYQKLQARASWLAQQLAKSGVVPGDAVTLLYPPGFDYICGLLGCSLAGAIPVSGVPPTPPRMNSDNLRHRRNAERFLSVVRGSRTRALLGPAELVGQFAKALPAQQDKIAVIEDNGETSSVSENSPGFLMASDDLAALQYTSGSTGAPKGVMLSHANILHNAFAQATVFEYGPNDRGVSWLPFFHDMGLVGAAFAAMAGRFPVTLMSPVHFVERPMRWIRALSHQRATVSWAPNFAFNLAVDTYDAASAADLDLSSLRLLFNGSEPVSPTTIDRFSACYARHGFDANSVYNAYGLADATLFAAGRSIYAKTARRRLSKEAMSAGIVSSASGEQDKSITLVSCGGAIPDSRIEVVDPECGKPCPAGTLGEVWLMGPSVASGYFENPQATEEAFGGRLANGDGPFLRTGDLGFFWEEELYIAGRVRDLIIVRGVNYLPQDIEAVVIGSHEAILPDSCAAFTINTETGTELVVCCEISRSHRNQSPDALTAIRISIFEEFGLHVHAVMVLKPGSIIKTPSGKIARAKNCAAYLNDEFSVVDSSILLSETAIGGADDLSTGVQTPDAVAVEAWLRARLVRYGASNTSLDLSLAEVGMNSVRVLEMVAEFDRVFGVRIGPADLFDCRTLQDVVLLASAPSVQSAPPPGAIEDGTRIRSGRRTLAAQRRKRQFSTSGAQ